MFKVEKVTFFEDRAGVCRVEKLNLTPGLHTFTIEGVSPYLVDKSLVFECENPNVTCVEMHARRSFKANSGNLQELKEKRNSLERVETELIFTANSIQAIKLNCIQIFSKIVKDCNRGTGNSNDWNDALKELKKSENELFLKSKELKTKKEKLQEEINELQIQHQEVKKEYHSEITLSVEVKESVKCSLSVHYITAAACWRPNYKVFVNDEKLTFKKGASTWQNCGEKWEDIFVEFSTERQQKAQIPELIGDCLRVKRKATEELVIREELIEEKEVVQKATYEVPGIEDDGSVFKCKVDQRATIPSQEQAITIDYEEFSSNVTKELVSYPMLSDSVNEIIHFENTSGQPLLSAPATIYRNNTLCGISEVKYSAPGQKIRLDLGNLAEVVVKRKENKKYDSKMMSSWKTENHDILISLSNLGPHEISFIMKERVPVSESDKAKIEVIEKNTSPVKFPDDKGIIEWKVTLAPYDRKNVKLNFDLKTQG